MEGKQGRAAPFQSSLIKKSRDDAGATTHGLHGRVHFLVFME